MFTKNLEGREPRPKINNPLNFERSENSHIKINFIKKDILDNKGAFKNDMEEDEK